MCADGSPPGRSCGRTCKSPSDGEEGNANGLPVVGPRPTHAEVYRLMVLGGGLAGTAAAREAARRGVRVAWVLPPADPGRSAGPTTSLSEQIRRLQARTGQAAAPEPPDEPGIDVYRGRGLFCERRAVAVGGREIRFRKALVATGTSPAPGVVDGADEGNCLQVETLSQLTELPGRLAVIGCGPAACEWAQAFRRFGSQVHLIAGEATILAQEEPDAANLLQARLEQEGVRLYRGCQEMAIQPMGNLQAVVIRREGRKEKLLVDRVLLCGPRQPNAAGLGLESASVAYSGHGIVVGDRLQTTNRHVFAAGGVCDARFASPQAAEATARLAVHNALSFTSRRLSRLVIPRCIYTDPAIAGVGLTPREAAERQIEIETYRVDTDGHRSAALVALAMPQGGEVIPVHRRQGLIAVHVRRGTGLIVGATVVDEAAGELIAPLVLLMTRGWSLAALADVIACRPSGFELLTRLGERYRQAGHRPKLRFGARPSFGARLATRFTRWWRVGRGKAG
jgi:pyruvate/2-oxoglutarate dehydrogenase complex dihydrolipoamide dehydrogenase (E3) component